MSDPDPLNNPQGQAPQGQPPGNQPAGPPPDQEGPPPLPVSIFWVQMGFFVTFWLIMMGITFITYDFSRFFFEPILALIFPIAGGNSLVKSLIVMSVFYWAGAIFGMVTNRPKQN